jgi:hypothetical protein
MRQRALPKPTPKGCPECGAQETRGTVLHRPTCSQRSTVAGQTIHQIPSLAVTAVRSPATGDTEMPRGESGIGDGRSLDAVSLGRKGGQSRASHLSPEQRSESARKAAKARWGKADA